MNSLARKSYHHVSLSLTALSAIVFATAQSAVAGTFSSAGYTWDSANSVKSGSIISGAGSFGFDADFFAGSPEIANNTVGSILGLNPGVSTSVNLGNSSTRSIIELNWGDGMSLGNRAGKDFVVYENGSWLAPEAYGVAVRKVGQSSFTEFRYQFSEGFEAKVFATGFDLSDFGIADDEEIDAIRIANLIGTDRVTGSDGQEQGFLGGSLAPKTGDWGEGAFELDQPDKLGRFDADITYVVGLHAPKPVPEASSVFSLLGLGVIGAGAIWKRQQHKKA